MTVVSTMNSNCWRPAGNLSQDDALMIMNSTLDETDESAKNGPEATGPKTVVNEVAQVHGSYQKWSDKYELAMAALGWRSLDETVAHVDRCHTHPCPIPRPTHSTHPISKTHSMVSLLGDPPQKRRKTESGPSPCRTEFLSAGDTATLLQSLGLEVMCDLLLGHGDAQELGECVICRCGWLFVF